MKVNETEKNAVEVIVKVAVAVISAAAGITIVDKTREFVNSKIKVLSKNTEKYERKNEA